VRRACILWVRARRRWSTFSAPLKDKSGGHMLAKCVLLAILGFSSVVELVDFIASNLGEFDSTIGATCARATHGPSRQHRTSILSTSCSRSNALDVRWGWTSKQEHKVPRNLQRVFHFPPHRSRERWKTKRPDAPAGRCVGCGEPKPQQTTTNAVSVCPPLCQTVRRCCPADSAHLPCELLAF